MSCCAVVVCFIPVHWHRALCCAMIFAQHSARSSHVFSWTLPRHCLTKSLWQVMVRFQTSSSCALQNLIFKRGMTRIHQSSQLIRVFGAKQRFLQSAVRLCHFSFWQQSLNKLRLSGIVPYPLCRARLWKHGWSLNKHAADQKNAGHILKSTGCRSMKKLRKRRRWLSWTCGSFLAVVSIQHLWIVNGWL